MVDIADSSWLSATREPAATIAREDKVDEELWGFIGTSSIIEENSRNWVGDEASPFCISSSVCRLRAAC